ncbi:MAG: hypothetical protein RL138_635 [Bacteroidota bacterium]
MNTINVTRLFEILPYQLEHFPKNDCVVHKKNGQWIKISTAEMVEQIDQLANGLYELGCRPQSTDEGKQKIALLANNRPEWNIVDNALMKLGLVNVPVYPTITDTEMAYIFNDASIEYAFVSDAQLLSKVQNIAPQVPSLKAIYTFNDIEGATHWSTLLMPNKPHQKEIDAIANAINEEELATIIYTSGTTGFPKGVMLTHKNIMSNVRDCVPIVLVPLSVHDRFLSFLPMCHILERMVCYLLMSAGVGVYYAESMETIGENIKEVRPHVFTTVPRLLEKVFDKIMTTGNSLTGIKRVFFFWALSLGLRYEHLNKNGWWYHFQLRIVDKLVFSKWRQALGEEVRLIVSGGAALQPRLARVFSAAKIMILEGYGLTETSPVISVGRPYPGQAAFGCVGFPLETIQLKFAPDGEICVKGTNIMKGYYKKPELTAEVIDAEGFFHTGDIGHYTAEGQLQITDRKKELFKTSGGKYVAPQLIENKLKESKFIEQVMVLGDGQKFVAALIVPHQGEMKDWAKTQNLHELSLEELYQNREAVELIQRELEVLNKEINHVEQVKKFHLLPKEWTIDSGELTPSLKLKRKVLMERYSNEISKLYL